MDRVVENRSFDAERAFFGADGVIIRRCTIGGPADGESAFKESKNVVAQDCTFELRYPFWHNDRLKIKGGEMTETARAPFWYGTNIKIDNLNVKCVKAFRECSDVKIVNSVINSEEFGWSVDNFEISDTALSGAYALMRCEHVKLTNVIFNGKYSFQYINNGEIVDSILDTKDALWHSRNVTVRNSIIKGEYLGWYSDHLTLDHCKIIGTQPLCYCKNLMLIDCAMEDADLCFEKSDVEATITTPVISIKNPAYGRIRVPSCGELIMDDERAEGRVSITT